MIPLHITVCHEGSFEPIFFLAMSSWPQVGMFLADPGQTPPKYYEIKRVTLNIMPHTITEIDFKALIGSRAESYITNTCQVHVIDASSVK